eukprot:8623721-Alexandrium_andersonii.AAC.1
MSASLVGSEMCIRDSVITIGFSARNDADPLGRDLLRWILRSFPGPVSYTHLKLPTICSV